MRYKGVDLDPFQEQAVRVVDAAESLIVAAPTGAGKTLVAEYAIERCLARGELVERHGPRFSAEQWPERHALRARHRDRRDLDHRTGLPRRRLWCLARTLVPRVERVVTPEDHAGCRSDLVRVRVDADERLAPTVGAG